MKHIRHTCVTGRVSSGRGKASRRGFDTHAGLSAHFGRSCRPGTLNIVLDRPINLDKGQRLSFSAGYNAFWALTLSGTDCVAFRYKNCPLHVIEIISPHRLRETLAIEDGDRLEICGPLNDVSGLRRAIWRTLWSGHESKYYTDDEFLEETHRLRAITRFATQPSKRW